MRLNDGLDVRYLVTQVIFSLCGLFVYRELFDEYRTVSLYFSEYENLDGIICCQNSDLLHPDDRMYAINGTLTH